MSQMIKKVSFTALNEGPNLLVLGAVHGNEYCGTTAINQVIEQFQSGDYELLRGSVTFIPICNPKAYELKQREVERNLNRHLYPKSVKKFYEDHIDPILCSELEKADYLLDLHSYQSQGGPFVFLSGADKIEEEFARSLGVDHFVCGWSEAFGSGTEKTQESVNASMGTTEYARQFKAKAVTLECGHHHNDDNPDIGKKAIISALKHLSLIGGKPLINSNNQQYCVRMSKVFYKEKPGSWTKTWQNFDKIEKGEDFIVYDDGTKICADQSGYLILPKSFAEVGQDWVYFGTDDGFPSDT